MCPERCSTAGPRCATLQGVTRVRQDDQSAQAIAFARRYIQRLVRHGAMDSDMAGYQLAAIEAATHSGRPVLVVDDVDASRTERRLTRAA